MELYIHIPFCVQKCRDCSFVSFPAEENTKNEYINVLLAENRLRSEEYTEPVTTVYIGGGTPSLLSPNQMKRLLLGIRNTVSLEQVTEFTIEANPGMLTDSFLKSAAELGVNRISIGMQSAETHLLQRLGRIHNLHDVIQSVAAARKYGFTNLNLDLIFGIPGQTADDWNHTLDTALSLSPEHISAYGLIPEEGTPLYESLMKKEIELPDVDDERKMYDMAIQKLRDHGLEQYEISNFAVKGFECKHNIGYWSHIPYIGLGVSASSLQIFSQPEGGITCCRKTNPFHYEEYIQSVKNQDNRAGFMEIVSPQEARFETMMLGLRMNQGVSTDDFFRMHGRTVDECFGSRLRRMEKQGLVKFSNRHWSLTRRGMDIQNSVLVELMDDE